MRLLMLGDARTEHVARWSRHFRARGDEVWIASAQETPRADIHLALPVRWPFAAYPLLLPVVRRNIRELRPDLLVAHYLPNYGLLAALSGFRPHVIVAWGSDLLVLPQRGTLQKARTRLVATRGQAFLVDAEMLVEPLARFGAPRRNILVCPFGADQDVLEVGSRTRPARVPVILSNRNHEPAYRIEVLLDALALLRGSHWTAVVANDGTTTSRLKAHAAALGLKERICWPGRLCRARYLESLAGGDIYVSTAPTDSTSVSLLEAMGAGLPVVVPDIPGNREWVRPGRDGLFYAAGDARALAAQLERLLSAPLERTALGACARAVVSSRGLWSQAMARAEPFLQRLVAAA